MFGWHSKLYQRWKAGKTKALDTPQTAFIHVGTHKTGTTSIQEFLGEHRKELKQHGIDFYTGEYLANNHVELKLATIGTDRMTMYKMRLLGKIEFDDTFKAATFDRVSRFMKTSRSSTLLFSSEGLSYLFHEDEIRSLKSLFEANAITAKIIMYTRNPEDFLASYAAELKKHPAPQVITRDSFAYVGPDTWLSDYETRMNKFVQVFGAANFLHVDYDEVVKVDGTVITSFLKILGIEDVFPLMAYKDVWLNRRVE